MVRVKDEKSILYLIRCFNTQYNIVITKMQKYYSLHNAFRFLSYNPVKKSPFYMMFEKDPEAQKKCLKIVLFGYRIKTFRKKKPETLLSLCVKTTGKSKQYPPQYFLSFEFYNIVSGGFNGQMAVYGIPPPNFCH